MMSSSLSSFVSRRSASFTLQGRNALTTRRSCWLGIFLWTVLATTSARIASAWLLPATRTTTELHRALHGGVRSSSSSSSSIENLQRSPSRRHSQQQRQQPQKRRFHLALAAATAEDSNSNPLAPANLKDKIVIQRAFYRFSPGSDVAIPNAVVVEERVRFEPRPDPADASGQSLLLKPVGPRTLLLRDGLVEEGEIGDDWFVLHVYPDDTDATHKAVHGAGAGTDKVLESSLVTALFLAGNGAEYCTYGNVLQLSAGNDLAGVASLLGCIGAQKSLLKKKKKGLAATKTTQQQERMDPEANYKDTDDDVVSATPLSVVSKEDKNDDDDDILTRPFKKPQDLFPPGLNLLVLTDPDTDKLNTVIHNLKTAGVPAKHVMVEPLDWTKRMAQQQQQQPWSSTSSTTTSTGMPREYHTVIASDLAFTYPEAKELARTVANRLEASKFYLDNYAFSVLSGNIPSPSSSKKKSAVFQPKKDNNKGALAIGSEELGDRDEDDASSSSSISAASTSPPSIPRFVHVCPDTRDDVVYLHRFLEKGYRMNCQTHYLKLEKLSFVFQTLPNKTKMSEENALLDDMDLELQQFQEITYQALTAQHHPAYAGEGSGEYFFPMETGEYDAGASGTYLEPETGRSGGGGGGRGSWLG